MKSLFKITGLTVFIFTLFIIQSCKKDPVHVDPKLISLSSSSVTHNDEVIITGEGFSTTLTDNVVKLDNQPVDVLSATDTKITIKIPVNIPIGAKKLTLDVSHVSALNPLDMKVYGWKKVTDHKQAAFYEISSFSIGNNIFFCAGRTSDDHYAKEVWKYDLVENAWTRMADFPGTLINSYYLVSFAIGNKGYLGLGSPNFFKDFWEFDPSQNKWTRRQDFPGNPWFAPCSFVLNGKAYVGIGYSDVSIVTNDFYSYTPETNIWTKVADLPGDKIREATTFVVNNKAYIIGGETRSGKSKKMWQYDDALNTWSAKSDFPGEYTRLMASFALNSTGYCGLAIDNIAHGTGTFWSYNPIENTWKSISIFPGTPRMSILRGTVGNLGYYGFGSESNAFSDLWIYTPFDFIP